MLRLSICYIPKSPRAEQLTRHQFRLQGRSVPANLIEAPVGTEYEVRAGAPESGAKEDAGAAKPGIAEAVYEEHLVATGRLVDVQQGPGQPLPSCALPPPSPPPPPPPPPPDEGGDGDDTPMITAPGEGPSTVVVVPTNCGGGEVPPPGDPPPEGGGGGGGGSGGGGDVTPPGDMECEDMADPETCEGAEAAPPNLDDIQNDPPATLPGTKPAELNQQQWQDIQDHWNQLNETEKKLCRRYWGHCATMAGEAVAAINFANNVYPVPESERRNGPNDALKHARWAAGMTRTMSSMPMPFGYYGESYARLFLQAHEAIPNNPQAELDMDWHNNEVGIGIGKSNVLGLSDAVEEARQDGELQEWACPDHPTDRRMGCIP